jgi:hypothetical protein
MTSTELPLQSELPRRRLRSPRRLALFSLLFAVVGAILLWVGLETSWFVRGAFAEPIAAILSAVIALFSRPRGSQRVIALCTISLLIAVPATVVGVGVFVQFLAPPPAAAATLPSEGARPVIYPNNPELTRMFESEFLIERDIRAHSVPGSWPTAVTADSEGRVRLDGKTVATLTTGESLSYSITGGGSDFLLIIHGEVSGEEVVYDYNTHIIRGICSASDTTCNGDMS